MSYDPLPNKQAIPMLQRATDLDPSFARAWSALGLRSYYDYSYSDGGNAAFELSQTAYHRALVEAPDMIGDAAVPLILARVERGDRVAAYRDAKALVAAWPANARAHYALAYVFRYAGLLDEATRECGAAFAIDPSERRLRTCALSFIPGNQAARHRADGAASWPTRSKRTLSRERVARAQEACSGLSRAPSGIHLRAFLDQRPRQELEALARHIEDVVGPGTRRRRTYLLAATASFAAFRFRRAARRMVENYCAVDGLAAIRCLLACGPGGYAAILRDARDCRDRFTASRGR
jgi:tetratricopeptide (TPR) repeat protein